jgi:hypothetical protein
MGSQIRMMSSVVRTMLVLIIDLVVTVVVVDQVIDLTGFCSLLRTGKGNIVWMGSELRCLMGRMGYMGVGVDHH